MRPAARTANKPPLSRKHYLIAPILLNCFGLELLVRLTNEAANGAVDHFITAAVEHRFEAQRLKPTAWPSLIVGGKDSSVRFTTASTSAALLCWKAAVNCFLQVGRIFHPHAEDAGRLRQRHEVRANQLGPLLEDARRFHFQFDEAERTVVEDDDFSGSLCWRNESRSPSNIARPPSPEKVIT